MTLLRRILLFSIIRAFLTVLPATGWNRRAARRRNELESNDEQAQLKYTRMQEYEKKWASMPL